MPTSKVHSAISHSLQERILSGNLKLGDYLPSESELCAEFGASLGPVRQALSSLRSEELISSGRGRQSVVLGNTKADSFMSVLSNYIWLKQHDYDPECKILWMSRRPAPQQVATALHMESGEWVGPDPLFCWTPDIQPSRAGKKGTA